MSKLEIIGAHFLWSFCTECACFPQRRVRHWSIWCICTSLQSDSSPATIYRCCYHVVTAACEIEIWLHLKHVHPACLLDDSRPTGIFHNTSYTRWETWLLGMGDVKPARDRLQRRAGSTPQCRGLDRMLSFSSAGSLLVGENGLFLSNANLLASQSNKSPLFQIANWQSLFLVV